MVKENGEIGMIEVKGENVNIREGIEEQKESIKMVDWFEEDKVGMIIEGPEKKVKVQINKIEVN